MLSVGHASMLLYSLLHLTGVKAVNTKYETLGEPVGAARRHQALPPARQQVPGPSRIPLDLAASKPPPARSARASPTASAWPSPAAGWPRHFNRPDFETVRLRRLRPLRRRLHDGGHLGEAASLAGHLKLANLCWIYDNNHITIEGNTALAFSEDVATRFIGYGWNVTRVGDANDLEMLERAFATFQDDARPADADHRRQPHRLRRAAQAGHSAAHGEPLGDEEIRLTKRNYGWPEDAKFLVPDGVREHFRHGIGERGDEAARRLVGRVESLPGRATRIWPISSIGMQRRELPDGWDQDLPAFPPTRRAWPRAIRPGKVLNAIAKNVPWLDRRRGRPGAVDQDAADLRRGRRFRGRTATAGATSTSASASTPWRHPERHGARQGAGLRLRLPDLQRLRARPRSGWPRSWSSRSSTSSRTTPSASARTGRPISPIEQLASLRAIPGLIVLRPADANEVVEAWRVIMQLHARAGGAGPRRAGAADARPHEIRARGRAWRRGAYVLADAPDGKPDVLLLATGSEVALCIAAYEQLKAEGIKARVVSMPSWELFEHQSREYRDSVIPPAVTARVAVEAAVHVWLGAATRVAAAPSSGCARSGSPLR